MALPRPVPAPTCPLPVPREGGQAPKGARQAVPFREGATAHRATQFRWLREYLATRRLAACLPASHQRAGEGEQARVQSRRMSRGARPH